MTPELWSVLLGLVVMLVTSAAKNPRWTRTQKTVVFAAVSAAAAVVQLAVEGQLVFDANFLANLGQSVGIIVTTATMIYNLRFKDSVANARLESVGYSQVAAGCLTCGSPVCDGDDCAGPDCCDQCACEHQGC